MGKYGNICLNCLAHSLGALSFCSQTFIWKISAKMILLFAREGKKKVPFSYLKKKEERKPERERA